MTRQDLVYLGVGDKAEQDKLLTAVTVLQDLDGVTGPLDGVTELHTRQDDAFIWFGSSILNFCLIMESPFFFNNIIKLPCLVREDTHKKSGKKVLVVELLRV